MDTRRGKEGLLSRHSGRGLEPLTCMRRKYGAIIVATTRYSTGYNGAPLRPPQLHGPGPVYAREPGHTLRPALRALPQRPRGGQRHHLRRAAGHAGRHAISRRARRQNPRAAGGDSALLHVQAAHNQRRTHPGRGPHRYRELPGHPRARLGVQRRFSSREGSV